MVKTFALCDVNSFYVSCERLFRPELNDMPVVVLSNNDGCIIALSDQAKAIGIKMGDPEFKVKGLLKRHGVVTFSSNYGLYGDMSQRFNWILEQHCEQVASYSVDESFMSFDQYPEPLRDISLRIKNDLWRCLSLPVCVGLGPSKTLAKTANHIAKKNKLLTDGVVDLSTEKARRYWLPKIPVGKIWGIGRQLSLGLAKIHIHTAWDLHQADHAVLQRIFSVNVERTILELRGVSCLAFDEVPQPKKSILNSRSFGHSITDYNDLKEALSYHVSRCCEKLRAQQSMARSITLYLYAKRQQDRYLYQPSQTIMLAEPSDDTGVFIQAIEAGLRRLYKHNEQYKKAGILLNALSPRKGHQGDLFNTIKARPELMDSLDKINQRYGRDALKFASLGFDKRWAMRANSMSPHYTSRWEDLIKIS
nr:Y-family DNA polymerase [Marinicella rhabdoformis]